MSDIHQSCSPWSRVLIILYAISLLAGTAVGFYNPLIAIAMKEDGYSEMVIGGASSLFFMCIILTAPFASYLTQRISMRSALCLGLLLSGGASFAFAGADNLTLWLGLRALLGAGIGLYLIGGQSAVNTFASDSNRTIVSGLHALAFGIGMGAGPVIGSGLYDISPVAAFYVCAAVLWIGAPVVLFGLPLEVAHKPTALRRDQVKSISLPLHAVFAYGVAEAILMTLFPVFMIDRGYSMITMSLAFSCFVLGGILSTVPLTKWADRVGQERVLTYCALVGVMGSIAMTLTSSPILVMIASTLTGASLGPVFALALALLGRLLPRDALPGGSALFTVAFSLGCMFSPWLAAYIMHEFGSIHIFTLSTILFGSLFLRLLVSHAGSPSRAGTWTKPS